MPPTTPQPADAVHDVLRDPLRTARYPASHDGHDHGHGGEDAVPAQLERTQLGDDRVETKGPGDHGRARY